MTDASHAYNGVLFLPAVQLPVDVSHARDAYRDAIKQAIDKVKPHNPKVTDPLPLSRLDVAVLFDGGSDASRSQLFHAFQTFVSELYMLACISAGRLEIDLDFPGGVDLRVYALDAPYADAVQAQEGIPYIASNDAATSGPFSTLSALRTSRMRWDRVFCAGQNTMLESFNGRDWGDYWLVCFANPAPDTMAFVNHIGAPSWEDEKALHNTISSERLPGQSTLTHVKVAVGGTFDHLHVGHKLLLTATIFLAQPSNDDREITIGITGDELLVNKKHSSVLESWDIRQNKAADFVESILVFHPDIPSIRTIEHYDSPGPNGKLVKVSYVDPNAGGKVTINYVRISDPFGPTITDESITALVISAETRSGGKAVNDKRTEKGWAPLEVFEVNVLDPASIDDTKGTDHDRMANSFATKISSTEIRRRLEAGEGLPSSKPS